MKLPLSLLLPALLALASPPSAARQLGPITAPVLPRADLQTVVVDDDYDESTPGWQVTRFDRIQDGVNAVVPGGTVLVLKGIYAEDVLVDKALVLRGAAGHAAEVEGVGGKSVFTVTSDGAVIEGFLVRNQSPQGMVALHSSFNTFRDNLNLGAQGLVRIEDGSNDNVILNNGLISDLSIGSYYGDGGDRNLIEGNSLLRIVMAHSHWNVIRDNAIDSASVAVELNLCDDNEISGNLVHFGYSGIDLDQSHRNRIFSNSVTGDVYYAVRLSESHSCSVTANTLRGRVKITGIDMWYSEDAYVADNVFVSPEGVGISVYQCTQATILGNSMSRGGIGFGSYSEDRQYWDSHEIAGNTVRGAPVYYYVDAPDVVVPPDAGQVILVGCDRALVEGLALSDVSAGIQLAYCTDTGIFESEFLGLQGGILAAQCQAVTVERNTFVGGSTAVQLEGSAHVVKANEIDGAYIGIEVSGDGCVVTENDVAFGEFGILLDEGTGCSASHNTLLGNAQGIWLAHSGGNLVEGNRIEASEVAAVALRDAEAVDNTIRGNTLVGGGIGVWIEGGATGNTVAENGIAGNEVGVLSPSASSSGNRIYHNDFANLENASEAGTNVWDDGFPSGGNHWDDYWGVDLDHDGLGEAPYLIPGGANEDAYPWMDLQGVGALWADAPAVSAAAGGKLTFHLYAGPGSEGRIYVLLGSAAGTDPGIALPGGAVLPLVWDPFTDMVLASLGSSAFKGFVGVLDGEGASLAEWTVGPLDAGFAGLRLSFAYALVEPWDLVSWPLSIAVAE